MFLWKIKRGNREIIIESKFRMLGKLSSQILVQENDFVRAGVPLSDGAILEEDILKGNAVQQYVNEIQEVYFTRVKINDKHFEVVIRQMMRKVRVQDPGIHYS
jgi:DNA-directed RNA polymerase subunit beta'